MRYFFVLISRFLVAATFLFSGFVKLVDPLGSVYKFEEYFSPDVFDLPFLIPFALPLSVALILVEISLGFVLLLGYKVRAALWALVCMTVLFLFLTWYAAYYDKVQDCGCFGDALKLTSWETFYKNIVLLVLLVFLIFRSDSIATVFSDRLMKKMVLGAFVLFCYLIYHVLEHLPLIDFRAYAVGKNLQEGMVSPVEGDALPPVHDFFLESETEDLTSRVLAAEKCLLIVAYNVEKANIDCFSSLANLTKEAQKKGYLVYGLSASGRDALAAVYKKFDLPFEFLFCDETTLKTIVRANPGLVTLAHGTVTGKWNGRDVDQVHQHLKIK